MTNIGHTCICFGVQNIWNTVLVLLTQPSHCRSFLFGYICRPLLPACLPACAERIDLFMVEEGTGTLLDFETERPIADAGIAAQVCVTPMGRVSTE